MKNYTKHAQELASKGRYGDDQLVHMNSEEVGALEGLASLVGRELTTNPDTGMKEAFNLFDILPFALNFIFPGMGTAAQIGIGALSGAASGAIEGEDPLMSALTGGAMSGIGSAIFGGADVPGMIPGADTAAAKTLVEGPLGTGVSQAALESADLATKTAAEQAMSSLAGSKAPGFWDADFTMRDFNADSGLNRWLADPLSKGNMPYTLAGGAAAASLMDNFNPFGTKTEEIDKDSGKANLRYPAAPRPYQPLNTPDLNTYGQLGSDYQSEVNYFLNNPGPYTGAPYDGDPAAFPFKDGGMVHKGGGLACYADGGEVQKEIPPGLRPLMSKLGMMRAKGTAGQAIPGASGQPQLTPQQQMIANGVPASLANMAAVTPGQDFGPRGGGSRGIGGRVPRAPQRPGRGGEVSAPGFMAPPRQIATQQPMSPVAGSMPVGQPSFMPATFNPVRGFSDGGIAGMPGVVDQNVLAQVMGGAREIPGEEMGMDDSIPAAIDGTQPAKLSSGEVVIPADVVSMLGDGNTRAGAAILRQMVERVRLAKTGSPVQSEQIDLESSLPA